MRFKRTLLYLIPGILLLKFLSRLTFITYNTGTVYSRRNKNTSSIKFDNYRRGSSKPWKYSRNGAYIKTGQISDPVARDVSEVNNSKPRTEYSAVNVQHQTDIGLYNEKPTTQCFGESGAGSVVKYQDIPVAFKNSNSPWHGRSRYVNLLDLPRPVYLENYKNPCWREELPSAQPYTKHIKGQPRFGHPSWKVLEREWSRRIDSGQAHRLRCLPYFYLPGFPKTGTTDLHASIIKHSMILPTHKSPHWWSWRRAGYEDFFVPLVMYIDLYDEFGLKLENITVSLAPSSGRDQQTEYHPAILSDASPSTLWSNVYWDSHPENAGRSMQQGPRFHVAHYIAHLTPAARFIISMRNPTDREYSWYMYTAGKDDVLSAEDFHEKVVLSLDAMEACLRDRLPWSCVNDVKVTDVVPQRRVRLQLGMYAVWLVKWLEVFPREQFHFSTLEEYSINKTSVLHSIFHFLGLDPTAGPVWKKTQTNWKNSAGGKKKAAGSMLQETRALLDRFYASYNQQLADLLQDDQYLFSSFK